MRNNISSIIFPGLLFMFILVFIGSILTAFLLQYTSLSESKLPIFTYGVNFLSLLVGGFIAGKKARERGWYYGGLTGILYSIILFFIAFLAFDATLSMKTLVSLIGAFSSAAIGGIFGVNFAR